MNEAFVVITVVLFSLALLVCNWNLVNEEKKSQKTKEALESWIKKTGHNRCHYYPEIFKEIALIHGVDTTQIPEITEEEFKQGCVTFVKEMFHNE